MCDMSSRVDAINNSKSKVRFRDLSLFRKIIFFNPPNLMGSLVPLLHSIINFMICLLETH